MTALAREGPLKDLRVIEMGQLLADFGAEVIKIEAPGVGDPMRQWGREKPHGKSLWWPVLARNKKSITLNLREKDGQDLEDGMNEFGVPCGLIYKVEDMINDEHFKARDALVEVDHSDFGKMKMQNVAPRLSETPGAARHVGPAPGEHNDYVFGELLALSEGRRAELRDAGII